MHFEMKFAKLKEEVIRFENFRGYLLIREFQYDAKTNKPISDFMCTRFFSWKEEFRNEVSVSVNNVDQLVDWNFHGLYDIKKLRPEHFIKLIATEFVDRFIKTIQTEIVMDENLSKAQERLNQLIDLKSDFYVLQNLSSEFKHDWTVFNFFLSGFKVSIDFNRLIAIECGLD